ncbi:hypothetical protein PT974_10427 [Cladobotryum mycophilum]|uniref:N-acetylgalactosaminide beta-1,3-galactosyltransferase n=1 Tax=Cladobotryum mycophilum TaxID=491253 RepID=A0ABR0S9U1_9HYPO
MLVTYKNNRLVPALIIAACFVLFYCLIDPSVENYGYNPNAIKTSAKIKVDESPAEKKVAAAPAETVKSPENNTIIVTPPASDEKKEKATPSASHKSASYNGLATDDILFIMKTGGTTVWKRLLVHLTTTLSPERIPLENTVIYSDLADKIGDFTLIDVLANMTTEAKAKPDFDVYRQQPEYMANNYYTEAAGVENDEWGPIGGWIIDKYKFIPLVQHAGENWPKAKWYVYSEDDAYLFLPNVLAYLSKFDHKEPHYLGSYAAKSDVTFAHGGAGFAISRGAWEQSFGKNPKMTEDYYQYTADHCCGDQVLAHALRKYGVKFGENGGDGKFTWGFNPVVHWSFAFSKYNWCSPLLSFHKVHNRDVAQYYELEKSWDFSKSPLLHRDFFNKMILPNIQKRAEWWDNHAGLFEVSSGNKDAPPVPEGKHDVELWKKAWESIDACEAACKGWETCAQWTYVEDLCKMDDKLIMGAGYAPSMSQRKTALMHTSGWMHERLNNWKC